MAPARRVRYTGFVPLIALLAALAAAQAAPQAPPKAEGKTLKLVEHFLKTPTGDLPPDDVPAFLAVDPATLPAKLRDKFEAKRIELLALKKNADAKYKPPLRMLGKGDSTEDDCGPPRDMASVGIIQQMGFERIEQEEEEWLMRETRCTECELRTEFTLTLITTPPKKKGGKKQLHYFLHSNDPIMTLLAGYRQGAKTTGTAFFGIGAGPKCR